MATIPAETLLRDLRRAREAPARSALCERFRSEALKLVADDGMLAPRYCHVVKQLDGIDGGMLSCGGERFDAPRLVPASGELTALGLVACTIGPSIERRVRELFAERRMSLGLALDALGNELLSALSRRVQDRMAAAVIRTGLTMAGELRPGDPGLDLAAQPAMMRLAGAETIGISVTSLNMLDPVKSATAVFGVGRDLPPARWSRCDGCRSRKTCRLVIARPLDEVPA